MNRIIRLSAFISLLYCAQLTAAPTGQQLLEACEKAISHGESGISAMMCEWYITPCNCEINNSLQTPSVCLPEYISSKTLGQLVINALKDEPDLTKLSANQAAAIILSRTYPCND